ncbi:MAG: hypothetical protein ACQKBT_12395, partial [Puniceicoccales bacterium]
MKKMIRKILICLFLSALFVCSSLYSKNFYERNVAEYIVSEALKGDRMFAVVRRYEYGSGDYSGFRFEDGSRIWGDIPVGAKVSEFRGKNGIRPFIVEADFCGRLDTT